MGWGPKGGVPWGDVPATFGTYLMSSCATSAMSTSTSVPHDETIACGSAVRHLADFACTEPLPDLAAPSRPPVPLRSAFVGSSLAGSSAISMRVDGSGRAGLPIAPLHGRETAQHGGRCPPCAIGGVQEHL